MSVRGAVRIQTREEVTQSRELGRILHTPRAHADTEARLPHRGVEGQFGEKSLPLNNPCEDLICGFLLDPFEAENNPKMRKVVYRVFPALG